MAILVDIDDSQFFVFEHHSKDPFVVWIDKQFRLKHIRTNLYDSLLALFIHFVFDLFEEGRKKVFIFIEGQNDFKRYFQFYQY